MKKVFILLILLFFCLSFMKLDKEENIISVFSSEDDFYDFYTLNFDNKTLSTKNFLDYFNGMKIKTITPYINEIYADKINFKSYSFDLFSTKTNIDHFTEKYIKILEELGYKSDALKARLNGIYIKKIVIYCSNSEINLLSQKIKFDFE